MAIRDVVTMGFGNGTFSPGVNKLPTFGYSIGEALNPIAICVAATDSYVAGPQAISSYIAGPVAYDQHVAGTEAQDNC